MGPPPILHEINRAFTALSQPLAHALDLSHLPANFPLLAWSALGFTVIHVGIAPWASRRWAGASYGKLNGPRARNNW